MSQDNFCFWSNLNMAYCCLFLFGKIIQRVVFSDLRASELQVSLKGTESYKYGFLMF